MNWKVLAVGALLIIPLVWVLAMGFGKDPRALPNVLEGKQAPGFALQTMDGDRIIDLAELRGKPVVVNFYSSWCVPCAQEHPWLVKVAPSFQERGVTFLGVIYNDEPVKVKAFLRRYGEAYPTLIDPAQRTAMDYGVAGVPETFLIDAEGRIARKFTGPVVPDQFLAALEALL